METTRISSKGQVVIPKALRKLYQWDSGQELDVIDTSDGLLLKARPARKAGTWQDVVGCLRHLAADKPAVSDEAMRAAVRDMAAERYRRSQKARKR